jgi:cytochrome c
MKSMIVAGVVAFGVLAAGPALASDKLWKDGGCVKCHDMDKKKKGESVKTLAGKFKGKDLDKLAADLKAEKDDHPKPKLSDADLKAALTWMVAQ